jgi:tetratricopeptide (TPR) repeat protein
VLSLPLFGKSKIEKLQGAKDVKGLVNALSDKDLSFRQNAAKTLYEICDKSTIEQITKELALNGMKLMELKQYEEALLFFERYTTLDTYNATAWFLKGSLVYCTAGQEFTEKKIDCNSDLVRYNLGLLIMTRLLLHINRRSPDRLELRLKDALNFLDKSLELDSTQEDTLGLKATILTILGFCYRSKQSDVPIGSFNFNNDKFMSDIRTAEGYFKDANKYFDKTLLKNPESEIHILIGELRSGDLSVWGEAIFGEKEW